MNKSIFVDVYDKIPDFIDSIYDVVNGVVSIKGSYAEQSSSFLQKCLDLFPMIIRSYTDDSLIEFAGDVEYWTGLLNKIIQTFQSTDRYKIIDVLYFETIDSIKEYKALLEKLELVNE